MLHWGVNNSLLRVPCFSQDSLSTSSFFCMISFFSFLLSCSLTSGVESRCLHWYSKHRAVVETKERERAGARRRKCLGHYGSTCSMNNTIPRNLPHCCCQAHTRTTSIRISWILFSRNGITQSAAKRVASSSFHPCALRSAASLGVFKWSATPRLKFANSRLEIRPQCDTHSHIHTPGANEVLLRFVGETFYTLSLLFIWL